jgi:hypothetical protein
VSTALRSSSWRDSAVSPGRTCSANSSVREGRIRLEAERMVTSKIASFPARSLFLSALGVMDRWGSDVVRVHEEMK